MTAGSDVSLCPSFPSLGQKRSLYHTEEPFDFALTKKARKDVSEKGNSRRKKDFKVEERQ